jgi:hypothetical protein
VALIAAPTRFILLRTSPRLRTGLAIVLVCTPFTPDVGGHDRTVINTLIA